MKIQMSFTAILLFINFKITILISLKLQKIYLTRVICSFNDLLWVAGENWSLNLSQKIQKIFAWSRKSQINGFVVQYFQEQKQNIKLKIRQMKKQQVFIDIPTASICLTESFPNDPNFDIQLIFKTKRYRLQKSILKSNSKYFERVLQSHMNTFEIKNTFDEEIFDGILSVIYGNATGIDRIEVPQYYQIAKFLEIQHILQLLQNDMTQSFQEYDTFAIMKLAHDNNDDNLFKKCMQYLQSQQFEQMKYHQLSLLDMDKTLFSLVIKSHNIYKEKTNKGLPYININKLIKFFCQSHSLSEIRMLQMTVQMIDPTVLTADQFKQIFMDPLVKKFNTFSPNKSLSASKQLLDTKFKKKIGIAICRLEATHDTYSQNGDQQNFKETIYYLENIYLRKQVEKLQNQNKKLLVLSQSKTFKDQSPSKRRNTVIDNFNLNKQVQKELAIKNKQQKVVKPEQKQKKLNQFLQVIDKLSEQFETKIEEISKIVNVYEQKKKQKIKKKSSKIDFGSSESSGLFLSSNYVHQMMTKNAKNTPVPKLLKRNNSFVTNPFDSMNIQLPNKTLSNSTIENDNKIVYENSPTCISKSSLINLNNFIRPQGFRKIILSLIYRRSVNNNPTGSKKDIFNKNQILIVFRSKNGIQVGGYISQSIQPEKKYIADGNASLFNLLKPEKYKISKEQAAKAIVTSDESLIGFANDLVIADQCIQKKNYCRLNSYQSIQSQSTQVFPSQRQKSEQKKQDESSTILGSQNYSSINSSISHQLEISETMISPGFGLPQQFQIQCLQIFEIREGQLQMIL